MIATANHGGTGESSGRIAALNDALRRTGRGGRLMMTTRVAALPDCERLAIIEAVRTFDRFDATNNPHGERDFGALLSGERRAFWKIDYYDQTLTAGSPDPADPSLTVRVLTIMLREEY
ncbi:DUF3768 domain-containing protein [Micromonospora sp. STR1s_5]|nr:DUF3768 domain-containing protein [Micromonospora sp. STR1s_5]